MAYEWNEIGGLKYLICSTGRVVKRRGMGFLKTWPDKDGYHKVSITTKSGTINKFLHRLVWETFRGPIPEGMTIDHINNNKNDNDINNLQLLTAEDNAAKGNAKNWTVIDPDGLQIEVYNLKAFCKANSLHDSHLIQYGKYKQWRLIK